MQRGKQLWISGHPSSCEAKDRVEACLECNRYGDDCAAALVLALKLRTTMETRTVELDGLPIQSFFVKGVKPKKI